MMRRVRGTDTPDAVPETGWDLLAGYVDGSRTHAVYDQLRARFPDAQILTISAVGQADADIYDFESGGGNIWPPQDGIPILRRQIALGKVPTVYSGTYEYQSAVRPTLDAYGLGWLPWWRADYRFGAGTDKSLDMGEAAWQFANPAMLGFHCDMSVVADDWHPSSLHPSGGGAILPDGADMHLDADDLTAINAVVIGVLRGQEAQNIIAASVWANPNPGASDGSFAGAPEYIFQSDTRLIVGQILDILKAANLGIPQATIDQITSLQVSAPEIAKEVIAELTKNLANG